MCASKNSVSKSVNKLRARESVVLGLGDERNGDDDDDGKDETINKN